MYGPYTRAQAERVAAGLEADAELARGRFAFSHHPHGVQGAGATTLSRYQQFLTADERRAARRAARQDERP